MEAAVRDEAYGATFHCRYCLSSLSQESRPSGSSCDGTEIRRIPVLAWRDICGQAYAPLLRPETGDVFQMTRHAIVFTLGVVSVAALAACSDPNSPPVAATAPVALRKAELQDSPAGPRDSSTGRPAKPAG